MIGRIVLGLLSLPFNLNALIVVRIVSELTIGKFAIFHIRIIP